MGWVMIEDFGEKIDGAAKDRWSRYRIRLSAIEDRAILDHTFSEVFPEPNYQALERDGVDRTVLAFIRAARDSIPAKPRATRNNKHRLVSWGNTVLSLRRFSRQLLNGEVGPEALEDALQRSGLKTASLLGKIRAYERLGHGTSLKPYVIGNSVYRRLDGIAFDPPQRRWTIENRKNQFFAQGGTLDEVIGSLGQHVADQDPAPTAASSQAKHFKIYTYRNGGGRVWLGRKLAGKLIDIISFDTTAQARKYKLNNLEELVQRYEDLKKTPGERAASNRDRRGADHRSGRDVTPGEFSATFGFRGVQFGNYVEGPRRQQDLNDAFDALMDLSEVLGCQPSALSLDGRLGLAFGARGTGGVGAAAAHYEPLQTVINLTKSKGAGSLAHEWFHALDNMVGRKRGAATYFGTGLEQGCSAGLTYEDRAPVEALARLGADLASAPMAERAKTADRYRSTRYYSLPYEISARAFEAWVCDRLGRTGSHNDYLANILPEEVFDAEARLLGLPDSRYPYPRRSEMAEISRVFDSAFGPEGAIAQLLGGLDVVEFSGSGQNSIKGVRETEGALAHNPEAEDAVREDELEISEDDDLVFG
ncbi:LPD5 domain-containing protein [Leisingera caerulea]|uniref:LPD5 domain-containing protein n=1 Tax=Leisingera caerulea TaxID=506591 RepID=UPI0004878C36|nr:LPD5 domain-containing protein [Leisingera caerulea]